MPALLREHEDAYGRLMLDYLEGRPAEEIVERDDGYIYLGAGPGLYFAPYLKWRSHERQSMRYVRGDVLDVGCGAGRALLHLRDRGFRAVGIDSSRLAIEVCRRRGLDEVHARSINELEGLGVFDTILLLGSGRPGAATVGVARPTGELGPPFWEYELIPASSVFLLPAQRYGDAPEIRFFAYRPGPVADTKGESSVEPTLFVPDEWIQDDVSHVPVTFPDGSSAILTYPAELGLASEGLQPDVSYIWNDDPATRHPVLFLHGPIGAEASYLEGDEPRATYALPTGGAAALWPAAEAESHRLRPIEWWLVYRTATWSVLASVRSEGDAERLSAVLSVEESDSGFPFVATDGPVQLAESFGEDEGPVLAIGDAAPDPSLVSDLDAVVFLAPWACSGGPEFDSPPVVVSTCLGAGTVFANIYGDADFLRAILDGLRVESFSPVPT